MSVHLTPNWSDPVRETYAFKTTVFTTDSGKEQRTAERLLPRRTASFQGFATGDAMRALQGVLINRTAAPVTIPDPARTPAILAQAAPAGATILFLENTPLWLGAGGRLALSEWDQSEFASRVSGSIVGEFTAEFDPLAFSTSQGRRLVLTQPLARRWEAGAMLRPALDGWLSNEVRVEYPTSDVMRYSAEVLVRPPSLPPLLGARELTILGGYPILDTPPNWAAPMSASFLTPIDQVDYGRGTIAAYLPIDFHTMVTQMDYLGRSREALGDVLSLFVNSRGRQGEFYCPTWRADLKPMSGIEPAGTTIYVGLDTQQYRESSVLRTIRVALNDGQTFYRQIIDMQAVGSGGVGAYSAAYDSAYSGITQGAALTRLTLDNPIFAGSVQRGDIESISWTPRCRFASDTLTIDWLTDDVGRTTAQIMTLEQL